MPLYKKLATYKTALMIYGLGAFALVAGVSKFVAPGLWAAYVPQWFLNIVPVTAIIWMYIVGLIEAGAGLLVLSRWNTHVWAGVIAVWLLGVAAVVASIGAYDIAFRDIGLALFALTVSLEAYQATQ